MPASKDQAAHTTSAEGDDPGLQVDEESVREFLIANGDFLQRNPDLLDHLHISHASGSAVSLVEKQVSILRERNIDMRHRLKALTANARDNDKLYEHTRALVVKLLDADSVTALCQGFMDSMRQNFQAECASIILFGDQPTDQGYRVDRKDNAKAEIGALLNSRKAVCGTLRKEEFNYLFPATIKPKALGESQPINHGGSAAIMPIAGDRLLGLIAVGSSDPHRYDKTMGTLFLAHIADVIVRLLPRFSSGEH
jgi:uncharacterized protein YigA (DUF484 family)